MQPIISFDLSVQKLVVPVRDDRSSLFIQIRACFPIQAVSNKLQINGEDASKKAPVCLWIDENSKRGKKKAAKRDGCNSITNESLSEALISGIGGVLIVYSQTGGLKESFRW